MPLSVVIRKGHVTIAIGAVISVFLSRCSYPKACFGISEVLAEKAPGTLIDFCVLDTFFRCSLFAIFFIVYLIPRWNFIVRVKGVVRRTVVRD